MLDFKKIQAELKTKLAKCSFFAIGYHPDADGIAATAILIKYLMHKGIPEDKIDLYPVDNIARTFELPHLNEIMQKSYDVIICIDYSVTRYEQLYYLSRKFNVIYIDHHRYQPELEKIPQLYINSINFPQITKPQLFTASKLINSLFYSPTNDWLELVGLDGDVAIQSILGSPIYQASRILNMLGLVREKIRDLGEITRLRNYLVSLLINAENVFTFLQQIKRDSSLTSLYNDILEDIDINLNILRSIKPFILYKNNKIYLHEILSPKKFEIAEHVLKDHIRHLKYNETFVIYSPHDQHITFRIYSSNPVVDCEKIARRFFGGGHRNRAGVTNMKVEDLPPKLFIEMVLERIEEMIDKHE